MASEVKIHGVTVGRVTVSPAKVSSSSPGRVSVSVGFKPDRIGMMHAAAREMDRER